MIAAIDALQLPGAVLTPKQEAKLEEIDKLIEAKVRESMNYRGVGLIKIPETDTNVLAAMDQRLKMLGWKPEWMAKQSEINKAAIAHFILNLDVSDSARASFENSHRTALSNC